MAETDWTFYAYPTPIPESMIEKREKDFAELDKAMKRCIREFGDELFGQDKERNKL